MGSLTRFTEPFRRPSGPSTPGPLAHPLPTPASPTTSRGSLTPRTLPLGPLQGRQPASRRSPGESSELPRAPGSAGGVGRSFRGTPRAPAVRPRQGQRRYGGVVPRRRAQPPRTGHPSAGTARCSRWAAGAHRAGGAAGRPRSRSPGRADSQGPVLRTLRTLRRSPVGGLDTRGQAGSLRERAPGSAGTELPESRPRAPGAPSCLTPTQERWQRAARVPAGATQGEPEGSGRRPRPAGTSGQAGPLRPRWLLWRPPGPRLLRPLPRRHGQALLSQNLGSGVGWGAMLPSQVPVLVVGATGAHREAPSHPVPWLSASPQKSARPHI